ncbi:alpha/beta hydrolase [Maricaulis sp.]|uniref:alpha/beta hydrolase n=1 Tax=Maricaulis sp. TaxID=1486257 RepID=UPI00261E339D|nr:alpha/beta hydrolase [Maricaulis sp.]
MAAAFQNFARQVFVVALFAASLTLAPAWAAQDELEIPPAAGLLQRYDVAAAEQNRDLQVELAQDILQNRDALYGFLTAEEIADLLGAIGLAMGEAGETDLAWMAMNEAVEYNRALLETIEAGREVFTTYDVYTAREALFARLADATRLHNQLYPAPPPPPPPTDGEVQMAPSYGSAPVYEMQADAANIYFNHLAPGEIDLQTMGATPQAGDSESDAFEVVRVFYGTNRAALGDDPNTAYGNDRADLELGVMEISVPRERAVGSIPRPRIGGEREGLHVVLRNIERYEEGEGFDGELRAAIENSDTGRREIFVYIHGHSVQFAGAARRTAQLAVDLDMRDGGVFFSWPTGNSVAAYQESQNNVSVSARRLARFLEQVLAEAGDADVHLIAHSMGNRVLLQAMERIYEDDSAPLFAQVFWASPDVDAENFSEALREMPGIAQGMTAYTSSRDRALQVSRALSGDYPRAGQSEPLPQIAGMITAVDTTPLSVGMLGHTDFATGAIEDIQSVIWLSLAPEERCMLKARELESEGLFWQAADGETTCSRSAFRRAITSLRFFGDGASERIAGAIQAGQVPQDQRSDWEEAQNIAAYIEALSR